MRFEREGDVVCAFEVGLADLPEEHEKGLMNCTGMREGFGLLFVYPGAARHTFWMKDTILPLAIVFLTTEGVVSSIRYGEPYSTRGIPSGRPVGMVLEIHRSDADCLEVGDRAFLTRYPLDHSLRRCTYTISRTGSTTINIHGATKPAKRTPVA